MQAFKAFQTEFEQKAAKESIPGNVNTEKYIPLCFRKNQI